MTILPLIKTRNDEEENKWTIDLPNDVVNTVNIIEVRLLLSVF
jgi:hypothetical protein